MSTFHLKISTPDGLLFDGEVERIRARMIDGDVCLLAHHADYVSAVGAGEAAIALPDGQVKRAACIGGMLSVINGEVRLIATTSSGRRTLTASVQSPRLPAPRKSWQTPLFPKRNIGLPSPQSAARRSV